MWACAWTVDVFDVAVTATVTTVQHRPLDLMQRDVAARAALRKHRARKRPRGALALLVLNGNVEICVEAPADLALVLHDSGTKAGVAQEELAVLAVHAFILRKFLAAPTNYAHLVTCELSVRRSAE